MKLLDDLKNIKVLVVGDVMLDRYWWGDVTRISPEAPVPVVRLTRSTVAAGGAANVAANIAGLGAKPLLVGGIGDDSEANLLPDVLKKAGISSDYLVRIPGRPTTIKTRVIAHSQQVTRIDQETDEPLRSEHEELIVQKIYETIAEVDAVAVSDYAKGILTKPVLHAIIETAKKRKKPVIIDPKGKDYSKYRGATILTPNRREAAVACNIEDNGKPVVTHAGERLLKEIGVDAVLITEGEEGMTLFRPSRRPVHMTALARQIYDVTGAGDTVIGVLATAVGAGANLAEAAELANIAAGLVVEQVGTTAVNLDELRAAISAAASANEQRA
jgi:rfaE bifunctional protein kinase chain/domain